MSKFLGFIVAIALGTVAVAQTYPSQQQLTGSTASVFATPVGGTVVADGAVTATTAGNTEAVPVDTQKRILVRTNHPNSLYAYSGVVTATALTEIIATPGAGLSVYITDLSCSSSAATTATADQQCQFKRGTGANCATGTVVVWGTFLPALGSQVANFTTPIKLTANNALCYMNAVTGSKTFSVNYYVAP